jgi:hypothetical protein
VAVGPASAASGGGCQLNGTAQFDGAGLSTTSAPFTYGFIGDLTGCKSSDATAPATGKASAGQTYTDTAGTTWTEPRSTGNGGCASSTTDGTAIITWADSSVTVISYHTDGAAAAVSLKGNVIPSVVVPGKTSLGVATSKTVSTTRYAGNSVLGSLVFEAQPTDCQTGVKSAGIAGFTGLGTQ